MKKKFKIIVFFLVIIILFLFIIKNKDKDGDVAKKSQDITIKENGVSELNNNSKDLLLFNSIINSSTSYDDFKKCDEILLDSLKENCISQIKLKYSKLSIANDISDCENISGNDDFGDEKYKKDVCYLNLNQNKSKSIEESESICKNIENDDLKKLCISQGKLKFNK